jgi:cobalt-zinc-cadmium efflux system membrane fusion protein
MSVKACGRLANTMAAVLALTLAAAHGPAWSEAPKPVSPKVGDRLTVKPEQMHQIVTRPVEACDFLVVKPGIGQIAYNDDSSSVVLAPFSGRVTRIHVKVGDVVKRGTPLFELESPEVVQAQTDLVSALHNLGKARSQLALAKRKLDRQSTLITGNATSQRDLDEARNDHAQAEADLKTAEGTLTAARNKLRVLVGRTDAEVARFEETRIINPTITVNAPLDGTVVSRRIGPGQYVRSDVNEPLFTVADLSMMWLKAAVPENDIALVRIGQEMEIQVPALPDKKLRAKVAAIGSASDSTTRRITVRAEVPNDDGMLKAEMFATFRLHAGGGEKGPGIPVEALVWDGNDTVVWVLVGDKVFQRRKVKAGREHEGLIQIREGLAAGEVVASRGAIFIDNEWKQ